ncbi:MAG: HD domain-containing protein [Lachnospiraceae bacterium]|nr:HD domain-containing protein [Lachnospiraceae bacterium]
MTLFDKAIYFAVEKHSGMKRKNENTPYILHPLEVAAIAGTMNCDEEILAAAVLHDTVEDTNATIEEIKSLFGDRVALLVASETEDKRPQIPPDESWRIRKEESLAELKSASDPGVKIVWLGDKLSNMRSFYRAWKISGDAIWEDFNQKDKAEQAWYYRYACELLSELKDHQAWKELCLLVETIFSGDSST